MVIENSAHRKVPSHFVIFGTYIRDVALLNEASGVIARIHVPENGSLLVNLKNPDQDQTVAAEEQ